MRSQLTSWTRLLTKLGIIRNTRRASTRAGYRRHLRYEQCEDRRLLTEFTVTSNADALVNTPAAIGTLRQAIFDANLTIEHDTIKFASGLNDATITLSSTPGLRTLSITESVTIDGTDGMGNSRNITISANDNGPDHLRHTGDGFPIFSMGGVTGDEQIEFNSLTLTVSVHGAFRS